MREIYNLDLCEDTIKCILDMAPSLTNLSDNEVIEKEAILKMIGCSDTEISNIIGSNPEFLITPTESILKLITKLKSYGFTLLNILFDSNPYILNIDYIDIEKYINKRLINEELEDIIDDLDSNPILFNEI